MWINFRIILGPTMPTISVFQPKIIFVEMAHSIFVSSIRKTAYQPSILTKITKIYFWQIRNVRCLFFQTGYLNVIFHTLHFSILYVYVFSCLIYGWGPHSLTSCLGSLAGIIFEFSMLSYVGGTSDHVVRRPMLWPLHRGPRRREPWKWKL